MDRICPKWIKLDQTGWNWIKKDQDESGWLIGSNQIKLVQIGSIKKMLLRFTDIFETQGKLAIYLFYRDANYIQALYYGHVTFHKDSDHLFLSLILSMFPCMKYPSVGHYLNTIIKL